MEKEQANKVTMDAYETADFLGITYRALLRMTRMKQVPFFRVGRSYLFRREALERWMMEEEQKNSFR